MAPQRDTLVQQARCLHLQVDIGTTDLVHTKYIRLLFESYRTPAGYAVHCSLDGVRPVEAKWSRVHELYTSPQANTISNYTSVDNFHAQLATLFAQFDAIFDEFSALATQAVASPANCLTLDKLRSIARSLASPSALEQLALAAKFHDDDQWYRARLCLGTQLDATLADANSNNTNKVLIEFVDYGNQQLTPLSECVLLDAHFAGILPPLAIRCSGVLGMNALLSQVSQAEKDETQNLLVYGSEVLDDADGEFPVARVWQRAYFHVSGRLECDEIYALLLASKRCRTSSLPPAAEQQLYFDPHTTEECDAILRQVNADQLSVSSAAANSSPVVVDAVLANMEASLQYVYFNLLSTQPALRRLEQQLATNERRANRSLLFDTNRHYKSALPATLLAASA